MKRYKVLLFVGLFLSLLCSACGTQSGGPRTWIDLPLRNRWKGIMKSSQRLATSHLIKKTAADQFN